MKTVVLELNWLDIIVISLAFVSLALNVFQLTIWWRDQKKFHTPVRSMLTALFNDIKLKINNAYLIQQFIHNSNNPHKDLATLRL